MTRSEAIERAAKNLMAGGVGNTNPGKDLAYWAHDLRNALNMPPDPDPDQAAEIAKLKAKPLPPDLRGMVREYWKNWFRPNQHWLEAQAKEFGAILRAIDAEQVAGDSSPVDSVASTEGTASAPAALSVASSHWDGWSGRLVWENGDGHDIDAGLSQWLLESCRPLVFGKEIK